MQVQAKIVTVYLDRDATELIKDGFQLFSTSVVAEYQQTIHGQEVANEHIAYTMVKYEARGSSEPS